MAFINCVIKCTSDVKERVTIRNEFIGESGRVARLFWWGALSDINSSSSSGTFYGEPGFVVGALKHYLFLVYDFAVRTNSKVIVLRIYRNWNTDCLYYFVDLVYVY